FYERYHTRDMHAINGLAKKMPRLAFFTVLFALSSIGLPGLNGFVSEFLTILGAFTSPNFGSEHGGVKFAAFAALGIILGAVYMLHLLAKVIWGPLKLPAGHDDHGHETHGSEELPPDLSAREVGILIPLALAVVAIGVYPTPLLRTLLPDVQAI